MSHNPQPPLDNVVVYHGADIARRGWWSALCAAVLTFGLFAFLPFTEIVRGGRDKALDVTPVGTVDLRFPPPMLPELVRPERAPEEHETVRPPEVEPPAPLANEPAPDAPLPDLTAPQLAMDSMRLPVVPLRVGVAGVRADLGMPYRFDFGTQFREAAAPPPPPVQEEEPEPEPEAHPLRDVDTPPKLVSQIQPTYPLRARSRGVEGYATVRFIVTTEGTVAEAAVVDSAPSRTFDSAARTAVERWRFEPGIKDGQSVDTVMQVKLEFRLN